MAYPTLRGEMVSPFSVKVGDRIHVFTTAFTTAEVDVVAIEEGEGCLLFSGKDGHKYDVYCSRYWDSQGLGEKIGLLNG